MFPGHLWEPEVVMGCCCWLLAAASTTAASAEFMRALCAEACFGQDSYQNVVFFCVASPFKTHTNEQCLCLGGACWFCEMYSFCPEVLGMFDF